jgi:hypothetical protein
MAYYDYNADDVRVQAGQLALQLMDLADRITVWKEWLDATPDADLTDAPRSMTSTEVTNIKSAATDMASVVAVFRGTASATQSDRQVFVKRLLGPVTY